MTIYFVILNYNTANETINLINSIYEHRREQDNIFTIIVDNASTDDSMMKLNELYSDNVLIEIYEAPANMGFSKANNWGYKKVLAHQDADLCIICNSDILITQNDFFDIVEKEYIYSKFGILSPDVRCKNEINEIWKGHQSPLYPYQISKKYILYRYKKNILWLEHDLKIRRVFYYLKRVFYGLKRIYYDLVVKYKYANYRLQRHENVPIYGAFIILSANFMSKIDKPFYPETLFYGEENLFFNRAQEEKIKIVYSPEIYVEHLQGQSTQKSNALIEKQYFILSNLVVSDLKILKEMLKMDD